jgi:RND family efflux transporter MFP subunit
VALPGQAFTGTVSAVDNRIDPQSRTLQVQALIPNDDGRIRAGMSFQITMSFPGESFASIDPLSIQWSADGAYVWKYLEGRVEQAYVQIVERNSGGVLVTGDVAVGDQVVTQGVLQLQQGTEVRILGEAPPQGRQRRNGEPGQAAQPETPL